MSSHVSKKKLYKIKLEDEISIANARIMAVAASGLQQWYEYSVLKKTLVIQLYCVTAADVFKLDATSIDILAPCGSYFSDDDTQDFIYMKDSVFIVKSVSSILHCIIISF
jgi:hypothetical protein